MANKREQHQARKAAVQALGKSLSRRARSNCELCGDSGRLDVVEVDGNPDDDPSDDWALLLCTRCQAIGDAPADTLRVVDALQTDELCACNRPVGGETLAA